MATVPVHTGREAFNSRDGVRWTDYVGWAGVGHLSEIVSLHAILCPCPLGDLSDEDWQHNVQLPNRTDLFRDLAYLLGRSATARRVNVLALIYEPDARSLAWSDPAFDSKDST